MAKMTQAQLMAFLAASGITLEDSANASVAPTSVTRKVKAPTTTKPAAKAVDASEITLKRYEYEGNDMVEINGPFRPFSLSFTKARRVLAVADTLRKMVGA